MRSAFWFKGLKPASPNRRARRAAPPVPPRKPAGSRLSVEPLDDRTVPAFLSPVGHDAGVTPYAIASADFNGGGVPDLAVANYGDSTVSVLLGNGDGTFAQPGTAAAVGTGPLSIAVGDFDGDQDIDIVTANSYDVSVLLGNGDGTFQPASTIGIGTNPQAVAVGDLDGDGKMDLGVTSNYYILDYCGYWGCWGHWEGYANVLIGNGQGGFSGPNVTPLGYGFHTGAAVANFNGDTLNGNPLSDFAAINADYGYVSVAFGDPSGFLQGPNSYYSNSYYGSLAAGDLDGDLDDDLVATSSSYNSVSVLLGDGAGGFGDPQSYDAGTYPAGVAIGDFDNDDNPDIATANYSSNDVTLLRGVGGGGFASPEATALGMSPWGLTANDFDDDGWMDIATNNPYSADGVSVLVNDQDWPPPPPPTISIFDTWVTEGNGGTTTVTFAVRLSGASRDTITVDFATADGSAKADSDYEGALGTVRFTPGEVLQTVTVEVSGDRAFEPTEDFLVNLDNPTNATIRDGQAVGTISDDEPTVSIGDAWITEGNSGTQTITFPVWLSAAYDVDVTVHFTMTNGSAVAGSDYVGTPGDVTIPMGTQYGEVRVAVIGDRSAEDTESFSVTLSSPNYGAVDDGEAVGYIYDNEPRITIDDVARLEGDGNGKNSKTTAFQFTVYLSTTYEEAVTVSFATANGTATFANNDYQARSATQLTFAPGEWFKTVTILVVGDKTGEADETFHVNLSANSSNSLIADAQGVGTILNDDRGRGGRP